ncbi:MAG: transcription elongation factor GreA [Patescibacteria group bacterium]|jgi:transcription elongation factor GreA
MQIPIRKPGIYTHSETDPNLTPAKFRELEAELARLKTVSQPRAIKETARLALMGDFSENAAYQISKGKLRGINQRILDLENRLKFAEIIQPNKNSGVVQLGQTVTVSASGKTYTYQILGSTETDPRTGVISHQSPLGSALIGRAVGDTVSVKLANKTVEYKIVKID